MGISIGYRLKAMAILSPVLLLLLLSLVATQPIKAEARANLTAYLTAPPTSWEPERYNVTGTAPFYVTHTLGYNNTRIMGNVGIGDGTVLTLDNASNRDINFSENNYMAVDISTAPLDPARLTSAPPLYGAPAAERTGRETGGAAAPSSKLTGPAGETPGIAKGTNATSGEIVRAPAGIALNDAYHTILLGRPVDDMLYEYPLGVIGDMYARLIGLRLPGGATVNLGIRCPGYGY